jgi:NAD(P)-dependent dehydrogenase (short-subunit alcohol dehydrogenase family)
VVGTGTGELRDRVALVTGGTGALGRAVVRRFLAGGARVHVTWRKKEEHADFDRALGKDAAAVTLHQVDVTAAAEVSRLFEAIARDPGRLDILACIAGGFTAAPIEDTAPAAWDRMVAVNATSAFLCCRGAVPLLRAAQGRGRIVNVAARPALEHGAAGMSAYAASKAAVLSLTHSLAKELGPDGISVNAIVPSIIDTPANRAAMPGADTTTWLPPDDIADVVAFLAGAAAGVVTGSAINLARG